MLAVGALLLTASGGYYAYAQFAKMGRDDFVHQVPRPTLSGGFSSAYVDAEGRPSVGQSQGIEGASVTSNRERRVTEEASIALSAPTRTETVDPKTLVAITEKLTSSGQHKTLQAPIEAPGEVPAYTVAETFAWTPSAERISMIAVSENGRIGAAIEALVLLQARRPGYVGIEQEDQPAVEQIDTEQFEIEPTAGNSTGISIVSPNSNRNPTTNEQMIAALLDSNFKRATPTIPEPGVRHANDNSRNRPESRYRRARSRRRGRQPGVGDPEARRGTHSNHGEARNCRARAGTSATSKVPLAVRATYSASCLNWPLGSSGEKSSPSNWTRAATGTSTRSIAPTSSTRVTSPCRTQA